MVEIFIAAMRGEVGESLRLPELALLRASSFGGSDPAMSARLLADMQGRVAAGIVNCDVVEVKEPTGKWLTEREWDPNRDSPLTRGQPVRERWDSKPAHLPNAVTETHIRTEQRITKAQARALFKSDPTNWSEGARLWAGIESRDERNDSPEIENEPQPTRIDFEDRKIESQVAEILQQAGQSNDLPMKKSALRSVLLQPLMSAGIPRQRIESIFKNLDKRQGVTVGTGQYSPAGVVRYVLTHAVRSASSSPAKPRPMQASASGGR